jgi:hypothetical protein
MKRSIELLLSFSSFSIHNSSFSFTYPLVAEGRRGKYGTDRVVRLSV